MYSLPPLSEFILENQLLVVAHRGSSGTAPENTLRSIREAITSGAQMIEIDIQSTFDNKLVVFHDTVLGRTTNGHGRINQKTYNEISELSAGEWFHPQFANERVPLLGQVLEEIAGHVYLNIEIKPPSGDEHPYQKTEILAEVIEKYGLQKYTLFSSFFHPALEFLKKKSSDFHIAALHIPNDTRMPSEICGKIGAEAYVCSMKELTKKRAKDAAEHNIYTGVYVVNSSDDVHKAIERGANGLVTNFPARIIEYLRAIN